MSDLALRVHDLAKVYRLGEGRRPQDTLREAIVGTGKALVRRRGPRVERADIWALDGVSFDVPPGQVLGIVGRNGAGKTTLLKILSRVTEPTRGEVQIWGRVGALLEVGTGFHADLTGRENVYLNGAILGMPRRVIDAKFDRIVEFAEVEQFIDTPVKRYSSGMYLRLAFAVAAHLDPDILIVDEVLAVGDAAFQRKCLGKMDEVTGLGRTVLLVSHNMPTVMSLASTCLWLDRGKIRALGPTAEVVAEYLASDQAAHEPGYADLTDDRLRRDVSGKAKRLRQVRVDWLRMQDARGETVGVFFEGEPLEITFGLRSAIPARELEVMCFFRTPDGTTVFACGTGLRDVDLEPGPVELTLRLPANPLRPGRYRLDLALETTQPQDLVEGAITFEVAGRRAGDEIVDARRARDNLGFVSIEHEWSSLRRPQADAVNRVDRLRV